MSNYGDEMTEVAVDEGDEEDVGREEEDSFNRPADDDFDDVEPDDFDSEMKDDDSSANGAFTSSSSSHSLAFEATVVRKDFEALDEAALRTHMEALIADVASVIDEGRDKAALLLRTHKSPHHPPLLTPSPHCTRPWASSHSPPPPRLLPLLMLPLCAGAEVRWNKEKLIAEYFEDPQRMLRKVGIEVSFKPSLSYTTPPHHPVLPPLSAHSTLYFALSLCLCSTSTRRTMPTARACLLPTTSVAPSAMTRWPSPTRTV